MKEKFFNLWNACKELPKTELASQFSATKGKNYDKCGVKFLLIGRAPNGWTLGSTPEDMAKKAQERLYDLAECAGWTEKRGNGLYSGDYSLNRSPFWNYAEEIWRGIGEPAVEAAGSIWLENIAWSNLYKLSPKEGNPSEQSKAKQTKICREILKEEILALKPTHILIMTGMAGWAEHFEECFDEFYDTGKRNVCRGKNKNDDYVEAFAKTGEAKAVVLCRPERREKKKYIAAALKAFENL